MYTVHDDVGHLGIFVSGKVARKEHDEFAHNIDLIDVLHRKTVSSPLDWLYFEACRVCENGGAKVGHGSGGIVLPRAA